METREKILKYISEKGPLSGKELCKYLNISRQALNKHIRELITSKKIQKEGKTRGTVYSITTKKRKLSIKKLSKKYDLQGLEEHRVFAEISLLLNLKKELNRNAFEIVEYAFNEMLNNAIDHSLSGDCRINTVIDRYSINFHIKDHGIGIFNSISKKFNLTGESSAIGELVKGKTTTMKEKHTGEGIFFTSKSVDKIYFRSHKIKLAFDNQIEDIFVEEKKFIKGTEVAFDISKQTKRKLTEIFEQFSPEEFDYKFEKTKVFVKLFSKNYVSRSEARRLLAGLDKFKEINLDFKDVRSTGQGFADEIFRVFLNEHPFIRIKITNLSSPLEQIINHVVDNKIKSRLTII